MGGLHLVSRLISNNFPSFPTSYLSICLFLSSLVLVIFIKDAVSDRQAAGAKPTGCRRLGLQNGFSNISKTALLSRFHAKTKPANTINDDRCRVQALFIYPIKSCAPVELQHSEVIQTGLAYDRHFSFAQYVTREVPSRTTSGQADTEQRWKFVTQREFPLFAKVHTELWVPDPSSPTYSPEAEFVQTGGCIIVSYPVTASISFSKEGIGNFFRLLFTKLIKLDLSAQPTNSFSIPFHPPPSRITSKKYTTEPLIIWKEFHPTLNVTNEIPPDILADFSCFLGARNPIALFRIDPNLPREVYRCAPRKETIGYQPIVGLADAYPLHLLSVTSIDDVSARLGSKTPLSPLRFRGNILVSGAPAFAEDSWACIRIGGRLYHVSCRTARCTLPNVDPETAVPDPKNQPYSIMASYRRIDGGAAVWPCLGMQLTPMDGGRGDMSVGDEIEILEETDSHYYIKQ